MSQHPDYLAQFKIYIVGAGLATYKTRLIITYQQNPPLFTVSTLLPDVACYVSTLLPDVACYVSTWRDSLRDSFAYRTMFKAATPDVTSTIPTT